MKKRLIKKYVKHRPCGKLMMYEFVEVYSDGSKKSTIEFFTNSQAVAK